MQIFLSKSFKFLSFLLVLSMSFLSCENDAENQKTTNEVAQQIRRFTRGPISANSSISVQFVEEIPKSYSVGDDINGIFEISPNANGVCRISSRNSIEFTPKDKLQYGTMYSVKVHLKKLFPNNKSDFNFKVQTIPLHLDLHITGLKPELDSKSPNYQLLGKLLATDKINYEKAKECLTCSFINEKKEIVFYEQEDEKEVSFVIHNIPRQEDNQTLRISLNGTPLNIDTKISEDINIPGKNSFELTKVSVIEEPTEHIEIRFSDFLKKNQDLKGLIEIKNVQKFTFSIVENIVKVYLPKKLKGTQELSIHQGIKNTFGYRLANSQTYTLHFPTENPEITWEKEGSILPDSKGLILPFKAINLKAVDVTITKIFENNILQFLQENNLQGSSNLKNVGKPILKKRIRLNQDNTSDLERWNVFSLDLSKFIEQETGAIYRVKLSFRKEYAILDCTKSEIIEGDDDLSDEIKWDYWNDVDSYWWDYEDYPSGYQWSERENPCHVSFYTSNKSIEKNILASNMGIIAKEGEDNKLHIAITDLRTTEPISGVVVKLFNLQQQLIGEEKTDDNGFCTISKQEQSFALIAQNGREKAYLKLVEGSALSMSKFEVKGRRSNKGLKVFLYGERGVWRPGDSLHLSVILQSKSKNLPKDYPISLDLYNPMGQLIQSLHNNNSENNLYTFNIVTQADAPTGRWTAKVKVGGVEFSKSLTIETIKANRFKVNLDFGDKVLSAHNKNLKGAIEINWMHGTPAKNAKYDIQLSLKKKTTSFQGLPNYNFDSPINDFDADDYLFCEGQVNENGKGSISGKINYFDKPPGMLKANFMVKAYEPSGNFSTNYFSKTYSPYDSYVGIRMPEANKYGNYETDKNHIVEIATVDKNGKPISAKNIKVSFYKVNWRWWYDVYNNRSSSFYSNSYNELISEKKINSSQGKASTTFTIPKDGWGRYFVRVQLPDGHSTGAIFYADWPYYAGRGNRKNPDGASVLSFATDKKTYVVGEQAKISFPSDTIGRALISIENGTSVLDSYWIEVDKNSTETSFSVDISEEMSPNVYVHVSLLQPHNQTINDIPIRSYGIVPLFVENPESHLYPMISMKKKLSPEKEFSVTISERDKKNMTYTLAIVDEGLLDLTNFKTPDAWKYFYAKEALGVKTWDYYDYVLGAYGGKIEKLFSVGGDEELTKKGVKKAERFKPVVFFKGPFTYEGKEQTHTFTMPAYVGSVKVMVVAENKNAFGKTEKEVPVSNPLMILPTAPRTMSPGDIAAIPISIFAMEKQVKNVLVKIQTNDAFEILGEESLKIHFDKPSEKTVYFKIKAKNKIGIGEIKVIAASGKEKSQQRIELDIRSSNPSETRMQEFVLEKNSSQSFDITQFGIENTERVYAEISSIPSLNIGKHLNYLIHYPYGCSEQVTSGAFAQLYLSSIMEISEEQKNRIQKNIQNAITILQSRQHSNGGIKYWPNDTYSNDWVSSYVGQFLWEAKEKGYFVPNSLFDNWVSFQKKKARKWTLNESSTYQRQSSSSSQAYRLYVLALSKNAKVGAMNRLRDNKSLSSLAKWHLAGAYALIGKKKVALKLIEAVGTEGENYNLSHNSTFGSRLRDKAIILNVLHSLGKMSEAHSLLFKIAKEVNKNPWMSTQTTAYVFNSIGKIIHENNSIGNPLSFTYKENNGRKEKVNSDKTIHSIKLHFKDRSAKFEITNQTEGTLYVRIFNEGKPSSGNETVSTEGMKLRVSYKDLKGNPVDPKSLMQGTDFVMTVKVSANNYYGVRENVALTTLFPPGWEIINTRISDFEYNYPQSDYDYQDIRDDRIYTFFDLSVNQKTFNFVLHAAYEGIYYMPSIRCEAMYDHSIYAGIMGSWVKVVKE